MKELLLKAQALYAQAKTLLLEGTDPDAMAKANALIAEAEDLKAKAGKLAEIEKMYNAVPDQISGFERRSDPTPPQGEERKDRFADLSEWIETVADNYVRKANDPRLKIWNEVGDRALPLINEKQMVENVGASGGFLVPTEFRAELMAIAAETGIVRPRANVIRMARRQLDIPVLDQTATTAGVPHWFGGMLFYWGEEAAEKTITNAKWRQVSLVAKKLIGYTRASDELVADSIISLDDFLRGPFGFAGGMAWMEDYAFLRGTGVGQPLGVINAPATISVARTATNPPVAFADLAAMRERFLPTANGVWVISQSLMDTIIQLAGPTGNASYIWQPNARDGIPGMLLGFPVIWSEKVPLAGSAGDIGLYDFNHYLIGDRQATTIDTSTHEFFRYDQASWRVVHRVDGRPWLSTPLTLADGTSQISPFVILGAKTT